MIMPPVTYYAIVEEAPSVHISEPSESEHISTPSEEGTTTSHTYTGTAKPPASSTYSGRTYEGVSEPYYNTNNLLVWYIIWSSTTNGSRTEHCYDQNHKEIDCSKDTSSNDGTVAAIITGAVKIIVIITGAVVIIVIIMIGLMALA